MAETTEEPLGIKNPLLGPNPLGQNLISPKFLYPLGASPIAVLDTSNFVSREVAEYERPDNSFKESPFFEEARAYEPSETVGIQRAIAPTTSTSSSQNVVQTFAEPRVEVSDRTAFAENNLTQQSQLSTPQFTQTEEARSTTAPDFNVVQAFAEPDFEVTENAGIGESNFTERSQVSTSQFTGLQESTSRTTPDFNVVQSFPESTAPIDRKSVV